MDYDLNHIINVTRINFHNTKLKKFKFYDSNHVEMVTRIMKHIFEQNLMLEMWH